jgi:hypothetical protein
MIYTSIAKHLLNLQSGERKVGEGMAFHNPVVDPPRELRTPNDSSPLGYPGSPRLDILSPCKG